MADRLPWFRFYTDTPSDVKIRKICNNTGYSKVDVVGAWAIILCLCNNSPVEGSLYVTLQERYTIEDVTIEFGCDVTKAQNLIDAFIRLGMLSIENDAYKVINWDKRQYKSDNSSKRVQKYREAKRYSNVTVTPPDNRLTDIQITDSEILPPLPPHIDDCADAPIGAGGGVHSWITKYSEITGIKPRASDIPKWRQEVQDCISAGIDADLIRAAVDYMRSDEKKLTVGSPKSIYNVALNLKAKQKPQTKDLMGSYAYLLEDNEVEA